MPFQDPDEKPAALESLERRYSALVGSQQQKTPTSPVLDPAAGTGGFFLGTSGSGKAHFALQEFLAGGNLEVDIEREAASLIAKWQQELPKFEPDADEERLKNKVRRIRKFGSQGVPVGQRNPSPTQTTTSVYPRDPAVRAWVLENAKGNCELCGRPAPFIGTDGYPFLEVHHVVPLAKGGSDTVSNAVALCPNCHRECHEGAERAVRTEYLYNSVSRLVRHPPDAPTQIPLHGGDQLCNDGRNTHA